MPPRVPLRPGFREDYKKDDEGNEEGLAEAEGMKNREESSQYKEQSGGVVGTFFRKEVPPLTELTADEIMNPNPEGVGVDELLPKNAGKREPGPFAAAYKCPFRIYKNPVPMPFIWK